MKLAPTIPKLERYINPCLLAIAYHCRLEAAVCHGDPTYAYRPTADRRMDEQMKKMFRTLSGLNNTNNRQNISHAD